MSHVPYVHESYSNGKRPSSHVTPFPACVRVCVSLCVRGNESCSVREREYACVSVYVCVCVCVCTIKKDKTEREERLTKET